MQLDNLPMSAVLIRVRESRTQFEAILSQFTDTQMTIAHKPDGWSLKDVLAHISFWESYALTRLQQATHGRTPELYGDITTDQINAINQGALEAGRAKSLEQVKADFAQTHRYLLDVIQAIPADEDDPWWALWPESTTPKQLIAYNTWEHYAEHMEIVSEWLNS